MGVGFGFYAANFGNFDKTYGTLGGGILLYNFCAFVLQLPLGAVLDRLGRRPGPAVFAWLRDSGRIAEAEMLKTFNAGIGMVAVVAPDYDPVSEVVDDGTSGWLFPRKQLDACGIEVACDGLEIDL